MIQADPGARLAVSISSGMTVRSAPWAAGGPYRAEPRGGCGLFSRAIAQYLNMDPGFQTDGLLAFRIRLPSAKYSEQRQRAEFYRQVMERMAALPGVQRVGAGTDLPLWNTDSSRYFQIEGRPEPEPGRWPLGHYAGVSRGYFSTLGIPLLRGRLFTDRDEADSRPVIVVNEKMAKTFWPDEDAVGKRILFGKVESGDWREIVGIVGNVRHPGSYDWKEIKPEFFQPMWQDPWNASWVILRTARPVDTFAQTLRQTITELDSDVAAHRIATVRQALSTQFIAFQVMGRWFSDQENQGYKLCGRQGENTVFRRA